MTAQVHVNMFYVQRNLCEIVRVHVYMHTYACLQQYIHPRAYLEWYVRECVVYKGSLHSCAPYYVVVCAHQNPFTQRDVCRLINFAVCTRLDTNALASTCVHAAWLQVHIHSICL